MALTDAFRKELATANLEDVKPVLEWWIKGRYSESLSAAVRDLTLSLHSLIQDANMAAEPRLLSISEFYDAVGEPPPSIVADILPQKRLVCFSGAAKEGKSLVALEFLHCVCEGMMLMQKYDIENSGPVAYFGLEDGGHEIKDRLMARGVLPEQQGFFVCFEGFDMSSPLGWATFEGLIAEMQTPPALVVIDTAREAFRGIRDWNDAALVAPLISPLRYWSHKHCTVILVVHNNKDKFAVGVNKISGSGALVSSTDSYMILEGQTVLENGDLRWTLEMGGRSVKKKKCVVEMDTNTLHMRMLDGDEVRRAEAEAKQASREEQKKQIIQYAQSAGDFSVKMIADVMGLSYRYVQEIIKEMRESGTVKKTDRTTENDGSGRPAPLYALVEQDAF